MQNIVKLIVGCLILTACGTKKAVNRSSTEIQNLNNLKSDVVASQPDFKALVGVMSVGYKTENESVSLRVNYRIKKDSAIWLSAKIGGIIPVAKALITPEKVSFYQKINNEYFEGDYSLINDLLGVEVDYQQLENLILGQPVIDPFTRKAIFSQSQSAYFVKRDYKNKMSYQSAWHKNSLQLDKQQINNLNKNQNLLIQYNQFKKNGLDYFPVDFFILASNIDSQVRIKIDIKKMEQVESLNLPFSIPDNYTEMAL